MEAREKMYATLFQVKRDYTDSTLTQCSTKKTYASKLRFVGANLINEAIN